jgi:hypothetical protein
LPAIVATLVFDELQVPEEAAVPEPVIFVLPMGPLRFEFDPILIVGKELITEEMLINSEDAPEEDMEIEPLDEAVADAATLTKIEVVVTEPDTWVNVTVDE